MAVAGEDKKDSSDRIGGSGLFGVLAVDPGATLEADAGFVGVDDSAKDLDHGLVGQLIGLLLRAGRRKKLIFGAGQLIAGLGSIEGQINHTSAKNDCTSKPLL